jgi:hypothetical protein
MGITAGVMHSFLYFLVRRSITTLYDILCTVATLYGLYVRIPGIQISTGSL